LAQGERVAESGQNNAFDSSVWQSVNKFSKSELTSVVVQEVRKTFEALTTPRNPSIRPVLVHVNGIAEAGANADYFDEVFDFGAMVAEDLGSVAAPGTN
jgi:hypothetical protein